MGLSRERVRAAVARLERDGELLPVPELCTLAGVGAGTLERWIVAGKGGVHLDGLRRSGAWYSTRAALLRFLRETRPEDG